MAKFQPGKSGNPNGRPPKNRALTAILERAGSRKVDKDGKPATRKQILADMLWQAATTGVITRQMESGKQEIAITPADWIGVVQFLYKHIDGPPPAQIDHSGEFTNVTMTIEQWRDQAQVARVQAAETVADFEDE